MDLGISVASALDLMSLNAYSTPSFLGSRKTSLRKLILMTNASFLFYCFLVNRLRFHVVIISQLVSGGVGGLEMEYKPV